MRTVIGGRVVAAVCVSVALVGAPVASAAQSESAVPTGSVGHMVYAQQSSSDELPWGLLGLVGLLGLGGLVRRRRKPVVADPLSTYPVMQEAARRDPTTPPRGTAAVRAVRPPGGPATVAGRTGGSAVSPGAASTANSAPAIPTQNRGAHERFPYTPRPKPVQPTAYLPAVSSSPTSVTSDGSIRLAPAPPLHADRLSRPNLDVPSSGGMAGGPSAEPQWPRRDYD